MLATRRQGMDETLDQFLQALEILANECNFAAVSAIKNKEDNMRDAFINGLNSSNIRQRLLESDSLDLETVYKKALTLDLACKHSQSFGVGHTFNAVVNEGNGNQCNNSQTVAVLNTKSKCYFCGLNITLVLNVQRKIQNVTIAV